MWVPLKWPLGQITTHTFKSVLRLVEDFIAMGDKQNAVKAFCVKGGQKGFADAGGSDNQALVEIFSAENF